MTSPRAVPFAAAPLLVAILAAVALAACSFTSTTAVPTASASPVPTATARPTATPSPTPVPTPVPTPTPTPIPLDEGLLNERLTVLIAGTDSNPDRASRGMDVNTDAMIVASIDSTHRQLSLVGLPRDTVDLVMPDGSIWPGKSNGIMQTLGIEALRSALSATYGVQIDYYLALSMADFGQIIMALDGIELDIPQAVYDPKIGLDLAAGYQRLNHNDAGRYVRTRFDTDYGRALRQQEVLTAIIAKLVNPQTDVDVVVLAGALGSLQTDIPFDTIPTLIEVARRSLDAEVSTAVLGPPRFALFEGFDGPRGWVMIPNVPEMRAYVQAVMDN